MRQQKGLFQLRLAMELLMSQNTISHYRNGERETDYQTIICLTDYSNISHYNWLERTKNFNVNH